MTRRPLRRRPLRRRGQPDRRVRLLRRPGREPSVPAPQSRIARIAVDGGPASSTSPTRAAVASSTSEPPQPCEPRLDSPAIVNAVRPQRALATATSRSPRRDHAAFPRRSPLTGFDNDGHFEVFRYEPGSDGSVCASCNPTERGRRRTRRSPPDGLSLSDDGRVFFNSTDAAGPARPRTATGRLRVVRRRRSELISTGISPFDSACSASAPTAPTPTSSPATASSRRTTTAAW